MNKPKFKKGKRYTIREKGSSPAQITYCDRFKGPKGSERYQETFLVFRLEPKRFPRKPNKVSK